MTKYPASTYITGVFQGVYPEQKMTDNFFKQQFAIDTEQEFNNIIVFEAIRTATSDSIEQLKSFKKGDLVKVKFNVRSNKSSDGRWFTNINAWKIEAYVPQDTSDFANPTPPETPTASEDAPPPPSGDDLPF